MDPDNFKSDFPSPRLESADVDGPGGRTIILTIRRVKGEVGDGTDNKPKQVLTFDPVPGIDIAPGKPKTEWLYGITVARCIAAMFGDRKSGWIGKRIAVHSETVEAFGEMKPALRIVGSPDLDKAITISVAKGRTKQKITLRGPAKKSPAPAAPQLDGGETVPAVQS